MGPSGETDMQAQADRQLTLQSLIDDLHRQQLLNDDDYQLALSIRRKQDEVNEHVLTEWLAEQNDMQCVQIDPLEVDVTKVTDLMSYAFAERHRILAVKVQPDTVVVACAEPRVSGWIADLEHVSRRQVQRVLAAPSDIERYRVEFYQLASSVSHARQAHRDASSMHNLESMLELGKAKAPDANDEHIVNPM